MDSHQMGLPPEDPQAGLIHLLEPIFLLSIMQISELWETPLKYDPKEPAKVRGALQSLTVSTGQGRDPLQ